ncbi:FtsB family cell division protein [Gynuella sunshinyii]|uniref:Septum formation initiator n=1 Tax=Gynuella sunshinyii YC6258 TaxID=1445510 RepID=A0A0C5W1C4_9GAMM|nr:septum formation initiator family protein [Gynuella sunshinyii]AJQ96484.1 septum formation initiator [Gynuella sunshinyii YC6258]
MKTKFLWAFLVVAFIGLQYRLWVGERSLAEAASLKSLIDLKKAQIEIQKKQNLELQYHVQALKDDPQAIEEEAREAHGLVKPDEILILIPDE